MNGKPLIQVGIAFIFFAIVALTYRVGESGRDQNIQLWPVQAADEAIKTLARSPLLIGSVLACGVGLVTVGVRKSS